MFANGADVNVAWLTARHCPDRNAGSDSDWSGLV